MSKVLAYIDRDGRVHSPEDVVVVMEVPVDTPCPECDGTGNGGDGFPCPACYGTGFVEAA